MWTEPRNDADLDPWLTLEQCAARANCHKRTLERMITAGLLRHARVGVGRKHIRIRASWLEDALQERSA